MPGIAISPSADAADLLDSEQLTDTVCARPYPS